MKTNYRQRFSMSLIASLLSVTVCSLFSIQASADNAVGESTISIQLHEFVPEMDLVITPNTHTAEQCSFAAFGERFDLVLEPNERLIANLPRDQRKELLDTCTLYRGELEGVAESWTRLSKTGEDWSGVIWDGEELYLLDPIDAVRESLASPSRAQTTGHVVYRLTDVIDLQGQTCGVDSFSAAGQPLVDYLPLVEELQDLIPLAAEGATLNLDMTVVADVQFSQIQEGTFGTPTAAAVAARINVVDGIFSEQVGVQISLKEVVKLADNGPLRSTNPGTLLNQFSDFAESGGFDHQGVGHLFTGRQLDGNVVGIAFLRSLCSVGFGVGVDEIRGGGTSGSLLVAHELGHNFGAPHDGQSGSPCVGTPAGRFLMGPSGGGDRFSQCSVNQMRPIIDNASCLDVIDGNQAPSVTITSPDDAATFPIGSKIRFVGTASDPEDGGLGADISWSSNLDGALGKGANILIALSEGRHVIRASVTDSDGAKANDTVTISVVNGGDGAILFESDFDNDNGGLVYVDDAFRGTSEPRYADGRRLPAGGNSGGGLQVRLGGLDNADIFGMSGGWKLDFVLKSAQEVTVTFLFNLIQTSAYEANEFSEALLAVDGNLVSAGDGDVLARIVGDGTGGPNQTTGWTQVRVNVGRLSAGSHTLVLGGFNNKKTFRDEVTRIRFDDLMIEGESSASPPPNDGIVFENHFDKDEEGFVYEDDAFRQTDNPNYARGSHLPAGGFSGGGLRVLLGGIDAEDVRRMSGGWTQSFTLDRPARINVSFRYNLTQASDYEADEFSEALMALNGTRFGPGLNNSLIRITGDGNGGPDKTTGWTSLTLDLGVLAAKEVHVLQFGAFNNKKTFSNEVTELRIDDVIVRADR